MEVMYALLAFAALLVFLLVLVAQERGRRIARLEDSIENARQRHESCMDLRALEAHGFAERVSRMKAAGFSGGEPPPTPDTWDPRVTEFISFLAEPEETVAWVRHQRAGDASWETIWRELTEATLETADG